MSSDLDEAKQKLLEKLGPNYNVYIRLLGKWFRGFISKEEFDRSAKLLVKQNFVPEHNQFWLALFHHCASNANGPMQTSNFHQYNELAYDTLQIRGSNPSSQKNSDMTASTKVRCLPNKIMTHVKIFVIVWEMGLDSINDQVSVYVKLALQHFLKNIITELICSKTAFRLRENRFKYAIGVRPMNPYLNNSLRIYTSNLEYDPYQIESNKMNSSLLDTSVYNDTLFPSRLYEAQALYEFACSTTSVSYSEREGRRKRLRLPDISLNDGPKKLINDHLDSQKEVRRVKLNKKYQSTGDDHDQHSEPDDVETDALDPQSSRSSVTANRRLTLYHLMMSLINNRTLIPSHSFYSLNLERIFNKYSC